jgi:hypothetical protein
MSKTVKYVLKIHQFIESTKINKENHKNASKNVHLRLKQITSKIHSFFKYLIVQKIDF